MGELEKYLRSWRDIRKTIPPLRPYGSVEAILQNMRQREAAENERCWMHVDDFKRIMENCPLISSVHSDIIASLTEIPEEDRTADAQTVVWLSDWLKLLAPN